MKRTMPPISLAGSQLSEACHVGAFFTSDEEEYRVLMPFIKEGFSCGDKAVHVVNPDQRAEHLQRLAKIGIDTAAVQKSGQLEIQNNTEAYLRDGRFDQDRMLEAFETMASGNNRGFPLSRIVCRMDWVIGDSFRIQNVIEFESRVNDVWRRHDDVVICTYRLGKFGGDAIIDILRTHPMVIIAGNRQHNPFFSPPEEFLREYHDRRKTFRLTVQDSGIGLATEDAERLFESFHTTKQDGMGIGLSISRSIIEAHRGRLWATPNDGPGATFAFSIPCKHNG